MIAAEAVRTEALAGDEAESLALVPITKGTEETGPVQVDHVAGYCHRYPGEQLTFYTRVRVLEAQSGLTLRVALPPQLTLEDYRPPAELAGQMPELEVDEDGQYLVWTLAGEQPAGTRCEFLAVTRVTPQLRNITLASLATVTRPDLSHLAREMTTVQVWAKGAYLRHLPELYEQDELMARFLMLFESFWGPVNTQINNVHHYLDPRLTPEQFLPWLASWLDLALDQRWPVERQRQLVRWAIALHRSRGTRWGLQKYLDIYTGQKARIVEHRAKNFKVGGEARLGPGIALGKNNQPHTFTIHMRLPVLEHITDEAERERQEALRRRTIETIIEQQKPAHTIYTLNLEVVPVAELDAPARPPEVHPVEQTPIEEPEDELAKEARTWFALGV